ncbi:hypothetical protein LGQ02_02380 [Bacillus shivajii]|uniref:hypothetical protein n=1 Tax=Bacillus shivajii TaxID=1983719 RepID=UPI001CFB1E39|nr:hypothetical protein [Bacillus shivajii]UCZ53667.1 hypothetical protein LGQ02_02380 [Bacillus shivajii]
MTKKNQWDEKDIEEKLKSMPPVNDERTKDELFNAIQKKMNEEDHKPEVVAKKRRPWIYPTLASAAAIFLILLIIPSFLQNDGQEFSSMDQAVDDSADNASIMTEDDSDVEITLDSGGDLTEEDAEIAGFSEVEENNGEEQSMAVEEKTTTIITAVPRVFDVDMGGISQERVALIETSVQIGEETGETLEEVLVYVLSNHEDLPLKSLQKIEFDDGEVANLYFEEDHRLQSLSAFQYHALTYSLSELFGHYGFDEVRFYVGDERGIMFGQEGEIDALDSLNVNRGYYVYEDEHGKEYLLRNTMIGEPAADEEGELFTFEETIHQMKEIEEKTWYRSIVPDFIEITEIDVSDETIHFVFSGDENISSVEEQELFELFLRGVLVTASDFEHETLTIYSESSGYIGEYMLSKTVIPNFEIE